MQFHPVLSSPPLQPYVTMMPPSHPGPMTMMPTMQGMTLLPQGAVMMSATGMGPQGIALMAPPQATMMPASMMTSATHAIPQTVYVMPQASVAAPHPPPALPPPMESLPPGWQAASTESGERFYIDHTTQTTHWQLPPKFVQPPAYHALSPGSLNTSAMAAPPPPPSRSSKKRNSGIVVAKKKTKLCTNNKTGTCRWGDQCAFAHTSDELIGNEK